MAMYLVRVMTWDARDGVEQEIGREQLMTNLRLMLYAIYPRLLQAKVNHFAGSSMAYSALSAAELAKVAKSHVSEFRRAKEEPDSLSTDAFLAYLATLGVGGLVLESLRKERYEEAYNAMVDDFGATRERRGLGMYTVTRILSNVQGTNCTGFAGHGTQTVYFNTAEKVSVGDVLHGTTVPSVDGSQRPRLNVERVEVRAAPYADLDDAGRSLVRGEFVPLSMVAARLGIVTLDAFITKFGHPQVHPRGYGYM
jgi:hypothetical protein